MKKDIAILIFVCFAINTFGITEIPDNSSINYINITETGVTAMWNGVPSAKGYNVCWKSESGFFNSTPLTTYTNSINISELTPNTKYWIQVQTIYLDGNKSRWCPYSTNWFTTLNGAIPPTKPALLSPTTGFNSPTPTTVNLSWTEAILATAPPSNAYQIFLGSSPSIMTKLAETDYNTRSFSFNATIGSYYWKVIVQDNNGLTSESDIYVFHIGTHVSMPPFFNNPFPINSADAVSVNPTLSFSAIFPSGSQSTSISYGTSPTNLNTSIALQDGLRTVQLFGLLEGQTYYWRVGTNEEFETSPTWSFVTQKGQYPPSIPINPIPINLETDVSDTLSLNWISNDVVDDSVIYDVYIGTSSSNLNFYCSSENTNVPVILEQSQTYYWKVVSNDYWGNSSQSNIWSFTTSFPKNNQNITFNTLSVKTYGDADFDPGATASSGLPVTYTSSDENIATIINNKVHIVATGVCTIYANQAGNTNYNPATQVSMPLLVAQFIPDFNSFIYTPVPNMSYQPFLNIDLNCIIPPASLLYQSASILYIVYVQKADGDLMLYYVPYSSTNFTFPGIVGNCKVSVKIDFTNSNCRSSIFDLSTFIISKANQTITFPPFDASYYNYSNTFGNNDFNIIASVNSGNPIIYTSETISVATIVNGKVHMVSAGTSIITANVAGNDNYNPVSLSQILTVNKANQTITFTTLPVKTYGDADFSPVATAASGLPIAYSSSNSAIATIVGGNIQVVGAGTCTIYANQAGNTNYLAATQVGQELTVNKTAQTITFNALSPKAFGDADFGLTATCTSGLELTYSSSNTDLATVENGTVHIVGAGSCTISANQSGNANYNPATEISQQLTINKADQSISFDALSDKTYGDTDFYLTATATSSLEVNFTSSDASVAIVENGMLHILGAGTCTIYASQAGNTNYLAATQVSQELTVNKAAQTITFNALPEKTFGDEDFNLTASTTSGLELTYSPSNTEIATVENGTVHIVGAGSCTIYANQSGNNNYLAASQLSQELTVNKATQIITFNALPVKTFGDADFDVTASTTSGIELTYSSSNTDVATIINGTVHIVGAGTCTIYADQSGNDNYWAATQVSQELTVNKAAQTITFNALSDKTYGDADFTLMASSTSDLVLTYSSSNTNVATIENGTVHIVGAGSCTINADQTGDENYLAASQVSQELTMNKAAQTITFNALPEKTFGDADFDVTASATSDLAITYSSSSNDVATIVNGTVHIVGAGTCTIYASQAGNTNYLAATQVNQELTVNKAAQTITFNALSDKIFGDGDFALTASAGSNLAVSYSSSNIDVATIENGGLHIVGAGSCSIYADQTGNDNYLAATQVSQEFTVNKAAQTITFNALSEKTFGDADFDVTASATSDLVLSYSSSNTNVATIENGTVHIVGAGSCILYADQSGNDNYLAAAQVSQELTVNKASQAITFEALPNKTFGDVDFDLIASTTSGLELTYSSSNTNIATIENGTVHIVCAGTCTIYADQAGNNNYSAADTIGQNLSITKKTVSFVPIANQAKIYGDTDPVLLFEVYPPLNQNDTLTGKLTREPGEDAGEYSILQGTLAANSNYELSFTNRKFTINKRNLTIVAQNKEKFFGEPNPEFSLLFEGLVINETESVIDSLPLINCSANENSICDAYPIELTSGFDNNYAISTNTGLLTILPVLGSVQTLSAEIIGSTIVKANGEVSSHGGDLYASRGFVYAETPNPSQNRIEAGQGMGTFSQYIEKLNSNTTYYLRSFVENGAGVSYGNEITFTTNATAVQQMESNQIKIYPNPSDGKFEVDISGDISGEIKVMILDAVGKTLQNTKYENINRFEIDLSDAKQGIYFCKIVFDGNMLMQKLVKE